MYDQNVIKIVNATCVLHNYPCTARLDAANVMGRLDPDGVPYLQPQAMLCDLQNQGYHSTDAAQRVRRIYKDYFNSEVWGSSLAGESHARFIRTVCMRRIWWSCEGLTSVHNEYTGYTLKHLLLRHMYNLSLPNLCATCSSLAALRLPTARVPDCYSLLFNSLSLSLSLLLSAHCTVRCLI